MDYNFIKMNSVVNTQTVSEESVTCFTVKEDKHQHRKELKNRGSTETAARVIARPHVEERHGASNHRTQKLVA